MSDDNNKLLAAVLETVNSLRDDLKEHIHDEESDLKEIRKSSEERHKLAEHRHAEIVAALNKVNVIEAMPRDEEGNPDLKGHRHEHERRRRRFDKLNNWLLETLSGGSKYAMGAAGLWVLYAIWQAFLTSIK